MRVLAMDTSGESVSAAAVDGGRIIFEAFERTGQTHSARLLTLVECALAAAGWGMDDVERIAAVVGPGSYTGVRIGVSTARGLAQGAGVPCVGLDSLEVLASQAIGLGFRRVCAMLDARAGQVYAAVFDCGGDKPIRLAEDAALALDDFLNGVQGDGGAAFTGGGAVSARERILGRIGRKAVILPEAFAHPRASAAGMLAADRPAVSYNELTPLYLRAPQAERERAARERK
ncbi:MAG: tRNA (adenosine(37)-N6)-threonylcarbamoyltransferase complex dimerization subunit type 1 TsaB [Oscillospiraceae bacterium]|jgi:tRNA threonylcarbamoyladenosine biosynthesis protein TsaB|nr:tRNA (adenosine(37)-N6)-threonylcarbamoyltransferase complex dimerization subunit type 1 TsaB [Oscillospiraceae bacterium]